VDGLVIGRGEELTGGNTRGEAFSEATWSKPMPSAKNPELPEFFVYEFSANGVPFYIGIGRAERASDRIRYAKYLLSRERRGKPVKWVLSTRVIAALLQRKVPIKLRYIRKSMPREQALESERRAIRRRVNQGFQLANIQLNPWPPKSHTAVLKAILENEAL
jgi:hypothetical protein